MTSNDPLWRGVPLDGETALALLEWQAEMGAGDPVGDAPVDRFALAARNQAAPPATSPTSLQATAPDAPTLVLRPEGDAADRVAEAGRLAASAATLEALAAAQEGWDGIELKKGARTFCFADGNPKARVLILGEAPGDEEDRQGKPFVGRSGQLLDRMFDAVGLSRRAADADRALYITNVLAWRPPGNRDPQPDEIAASLPFVRRHIELVGPDLVVLMGNIACDAGLGRRGILRLRGTWATAFGRPALPMTHPAYLLRNPQAKREAWADLLSIAARLDRAAG